MNALARETLANLERVTALREDLEAALAETLRAGWYGRFSIEAEVQDGVIQKWKVGTEKDRK